MKLDLSPIMKLDWSPIMKLDLSPIMKLMNNMTIMMNRCDMKAINQASS